MPPGVRRRASRLRIEVLFAIGLRALPPRVALFMWRARRLAHRIGDTFTLISATRPANLAVLLELARGRRHVVELGTGTGWAALALAVDDADRTVTTFDPIVRPTRERFASLLAPGARERVEFVDAAGVSGPRTRQPIDFLYIDSSHELGATIEEFRIWNQVLAPGATVVFDDYDHPDYPGVRAAVAELGLTGEQRATLFVWVKPLRRIQ